MLRYGAGARRPPTKAALQAVSPARLNRVLRRAVAYAPSAYYSVVDVVRWGEPCDPAREGLYAIYDAALSGSAGDLFASLRGQGLVYTPKAEYRPSASAPW